jgi:hypothetical protein
MSYDAARNLPGLALAGAILMSLGLVGCASLAPPRATAAAIPGASRDTRSQEFCALSAKAGGFIDTDVAVACRRREYSAEARAKSTQINSDLDHACEDVATYGGPEGPFSWTVYMDCIDNSI